MNQYQISPNPGGHRFTITAELAYRPGEINEIYLPVWIAGSYMRRDFSKYLSHLGAEDELGTPLVLQQVAPSRWLLDCRGLAGGGLVRLHYQFYGHDVSVRQCYLDHKRAIFNPAAACLTVKGLEQEPCSLAFDLGEKRQHWQVAPGALAFCTDYYELADTPFLLAEKLTKFSFPVQGVNHDFYISGDCSGFNLERLAEDCRRGCEEAHRLFGAFPPAIDDRYCFLLHLVEKGHGGLEHRRSSLLMQGRDAMATEEKYADLMGLIVHEYFHSWHVKDLKPATYQPYQLQAEQPDDLLWLFEGYTAYFDNYLLQRADIIGQQQYLDLIAADLEKLYRWPGRFVQTLAQSSIEAWTKFYAGGEDALNISVNYYCQGSFAALLTDLWLRQHGRSSLGQLLAQLWRNYRHSGRGLSEADFRQQAAELLPRELREEFNKLLDRLLHHPGELPLDEALLDFGLALERYSEHSCSPGFRWQGSRVSWLDEHSPAARAGVAVGDELLTIDGLSVADQGEFLKEKLLLNTPDREVRLQVRRDGEIFEFTFLLIAPELERVRLTVINQQQLSRWLD